MTIEVHDAIVAHNFDHGEFAWAEHGALIDRIAGLLAARRQFAVATSSDGWELSVPIAQHATLDGGPTLPPSQAGDIELAAAA